MLLISLLTATDALEILDRLGPAIGLDISANGLRRMGRILIDQPGMNPLRYDDAVDPELRHLFQLPAFPVSNEQSGFKFDFWPIRSAWAKSSNDHPLFPSAATMIKSGAWLKTRITIPCSWLLSVHTRQRRHSSPIPT